MLRSQEEEGQTSSGSETDSSRIFTEPAHLKKSQECREEREGGPGGPPHLHLDDSLGPVPKLRVVLLVWRLAADVSALSFKDPACSVFTFLALCADLCVTLFSIFLSLNSILFLVFFALKLLELSCLGSDLGDSSGVSISLLVSTSSLEASTSAISGLEPDSSISA